MTDPKLLVYNLTHTVDELPQLNNLANSPVWNLPFQTKILDILIAITMVDW